MNDFLEYLEGKFTLVPSGNGDNLQMKDGICPFCGESRLDLRIYYNPKKDKGICHHCGTGFNSIKFVSASENVSKFNAKRLLNNSEGGFIRTVANKMEIGHCPYPPTVPADTNKRALNYLLDRGITEMMISEFQIGFAENNFYWNGYSVNVKDRVIFPIHDKEENLVSWQGRDITGEAYNKYFFPKGFNSSNYLFNYHRLTPNNYIMVTEGIFDVLGWYKASFYNVVCTFGKKISHNQMNDIIRLKPRVVYMAWDSDAEKSKNMFCERYQHLFHIKLIDLDGKDADELSGSELESAFDSSMEYSQESILLQRLKDSRCYQQTYRPLFQSGL